MNEELELTYEEAQNYAEKCYYEATDEALLEMAWAEHHSHIEYDESDLPF
jgi:hypothetical protein